ncbi:DUF4236 domain-containing protein [Arthrobacter sp. OV608]|uniref:DUF4236 domain-containing protein n=1 Tax=Arthrobacter sp. OV608 TaxID=1882768 RepID=UPI000B808899
MFWRCGLGFRYRKSKSFGPVRITASKRGLSASVGAGPFRVTRTATGRTTSTVRVPGTGVSYVSSGSSGRPSRRSAALISAPTAGPVARQVITNETWRELLTPDNTVVVSKF